MVLSEMGTLTPKLQASACRQKHNENENGEMLGKSKTLAFQLLLLPFHWLFPSLPTRHGKKAVVGDTRRHMQEYWGFIGGATR